jgi:hypothetical protein
LGEEPVVLVPSPKFQKSEEMKPSGSVAVPLKDTAVLTVTEEGVAEKEVMVGD